jgi:hypothetical protein
MPYATADARRDLLQQIANAVDRLALALAALGDAYDQLDEPSAERVEQELFRPVQLAYGRAQRAYTGFAERHALAARSFAPAGAGAPSAGARAFLDRAGESIAATDQTLAELQDSLLPVEVGDAELREGLRQVRELIAPLPGRVRELERVLGR